MVKKKPKKSLETLIEDLARLTKQGFINSDKKLEDLARSTKEGFDLIDRNFRAVDKNFKIIVDQVELMASDIKDLKRSVNPIVTILGNQDREIRDLDSRLSRVERKVGISK
ncbi:MAG TPA: hypothetical protein VJJ24_00765 [Candidatus Paceibacterota bacterium]